MPAENVTVTAHFKEMEDEEDGTNRPEDDVCSLNMIMLFVGITGILVYKTSKN